MWQDCRPFTHWRGTSCPHPPSDPRRWRQPEQRGLFRRFFDRQGALGRFLSQHAFTVYVIHVPVIVLLALALRPVHLQPQLLEFALAVAIVLPLRFGAGYVVRLLPMASRVL